MFRIFVRKLHRIKIKVAIAGQDEMNKETQDKIDKEVFGELRDDIIGIKMDENRIIRK
jgi:hypothetical protein